GQGNSSSNNQFVAFKPNSLGPDAANGDASSVGQAAPSGHPTVAGTVSPQVLPVLRGDLFGGAVLPQADGGTAGSSFLVRGLLNNAPPGQSTQGNSVIPAALNQNSGTALYAGGDTEEAAPISGGSWQMLLDRLFSQGQAGRPSPLNTRN